MSQSTDYVDSSLLRDLAAGRAKDLSEDFRSGRSYVELTLSCAKKLPEAPVLFPLYNRVLVPRTVAEELKREGAPEAVQKWITNPPEWCEVRPDPPTDPALNELLDAGESAAITLAIS